MQREELWSGRKEGRTFVGESVAGALHCQIGGRWAKLKSGDIRAWGRLK